MSCDPSRLEEELRTALNRVSAENDSNTPDHILAKYLIDCLNAFTAATQRRETHYDCFHSPPGGTAFVRLSERIKK